jgi:hypothetical protein
LAVTIRAQEFQVLHLIIEPIAIPVVDVEHEWSATPFIMHWTVGALAAIPTSGFEQGPAQDVGFLASPLRSQDEDLLPGDLLRPLVGRAPICSASQEVRGVDLAFLYLPRNMGV